MCEILYNNYIINSKQIILKPDNEYYGLEKIFKNNKVFQSINLNGDITPFIDIVEKEYDIQKENKSWKYCIVRLNNKYYNSDIQEEITNYGFDIDFINYHMEEYKYNTNLINFNNLINNPPPKMTIIWIYNTLRAGKQLNTTNIGFIHDSYYTNTDTTAQSLIGRICGYNKEKDNVNCYVDMKSAERMLKWINNNYSSLLIPMKSKNILNGANYNETDWKLNIPIYINLDKKYVDLFYQYKLKYNNRYPYKNKLLSAILSSIDDDDKYDKINNIISNYNFGKFGGLMVLSEKNAYRSFNENWTTIYKAYEKNKKIRGFEVSLDQISDYNTKFYYIFCNMNIYDKQYGGCLIVYKKYLKVKSITTKLNIEINNKSRFNINDIININNIN